MIGKIYEHRDLLSTTRQDLGGKVEGLLHLLRQGANVPAFFILLPEQDPQDAVVAFEQLGWKSVAVRSSSLSEDGVEHSFAGMYESVLGIQDSSALLKGIQTCRESSQSSRIKEYRRMHNLQEAPLTVIVQEMIDGEVSGVLFSHDPLHPDETLISAAFGLGEGVVQGSVPCDTIRILRNLDIENDIAKKDSAMRLVDGHPKMVSVPEKEQLLSTLSSEQILRLTKEARALSIKLGYPLDMEWTLRNNRFFLLQARPITQKMAVGQKLLWDNSNIVESYCGLTLPLTYSFASHAYTIVYQLFCQVMGVSQQSIRTYSTVFPRMIGLIRGHIFYNLNAWYTVVSLLPGYQWNRVFLEGMMGVSEVAGESDAAKVSGNWLTIRLRVFWLMLMMIWRVFRIDRDVKWFHATVDSALKEHSVVNIHRQAPLELLETYSDLERRLLWSWHVPIVNDFLVMIAHGLLKSQCQKQFPNEADLHNALLSGEGGMISAAPAQKVESVVALLRQHPEVVALFTDFAQSKMTLVDLQAKLQPYPIVVEVIEEYIELFGDRCADELKLETETLRHNPYPLYANLASSLQRPAQRMHFVDAPLRIQAENLVAQELKGMQKWLFTKILTWARQRVQARENLRFERTRVFARVREVFRAMAAFLVKEGYLDEPFDIFYLQVEEIWGWVRGSSVSIDLKTLVAQRKKQYEIWEKEGKPADRFYTYGAVWHNNYFISKPKRTDSNDIKGTPACPGLVEGVVKRITDPTTESVLPGEILVCYRTDPGWAPLFPNCAAILVERGSLLSHSAVVARELGIPTIVAIPNLMERLNNGDRVRVRAADGVVDILEAE